MGGATSFSQPVLPRRYQTFLNVPMSLALRSLQLQAAEGERRTEGGRCVFGGAKQAAEKLVQAVILSSSEGSGFEFSSDYRFFVACWLLRMTVLGRFSAACLPSSSGSLN